MLKLNWFKQHLCWLFTLSLVLFALVIPSCTFTVNPDRSLSHPPASSGINQNRIRDKSQPNSASPVGIGLHGLTDWTTQFPFLDLFKLSRPWVTQCGTGSPPNCPWHTQENASLDLDAHGWVKSLPKPDDRNVKFRRVEAYIINNTTGQKIEGKYIVLYEGSGQLSYFGATKDESASRLGRDVININAQAAVEHPFIISINPTDPEKNGNYIRNVQVIKAENLSLYAEGEIFNPQFLEKIKKFKVLRFMDWQKTNNSSQKEWRDRPLMSDYSWSINGVPIEIMVKLANRLKTDVWFNLPHQASDDYVTQFAQLVKKTLNPNLKVYVEYSNELWNWGFQQAQYANQQGRARWGNQGDAFMQWNGMKASQFCDIWKKVYGDQSHQVKCVIATQTAYHGLEKSVLDCPLWVAEGHAPCHTNMDVYAITAYLGGSLGEPRHIKTVESWLNAPDGGVSQTLEQLRFGSLLGEQSSLVGIKKDLIYHAQIAKAKNLQLVSYEAGQHIVGVNGAESNEKTTKFFQAFNRHPEMFNLYTELLETWRDNGGTLFMHFVDIGPAGTHGSWGALENVSQSGSPKYNALIDFIDKNVCWWDHCF